MALRRFAAGAVALAFAATGLVACGGFLLWAALF